jgi:hypothetical protein
MTHLATGPQGEALPGAEVLAGLIVVTVTITTQESRGAEAARRPSSLRGEVPGQARLAQGTGPDHQGTGVVMELRHGRMQRPGRGSRE